MSRGLVPRVDLDKPPRTLDLTSSPPVVAEVYILALMRGLQRRAARVGHANFHEPLTLLVPAFDPDIVMWPSHVARESRSRTLEVGVGARGVRV